MSNGGSGVSLYSAPAPILSQGERDMAIAYEGNLKTFMGRLEALSIEKSKFDEAKDRHDASLAALNLGMSAQAAFAEAEKTRQAAQEAREQAKAELAKAKADAADLAAASNKVLGEAQQQKAAVDQELAAAKADRKSLAVARADADRAIRDAEALQAELTSKRDKIKAMIADVTSGLPA